MKQNRIRDCKQFGLQWNDFKVPFGAIYGRFNGVEFCCTKLPDVHAQGMRIWIHHDHSWYEKIIYFNFMSNFYNNKLDYVKASFYHDLFHMVFEYYLQYYVKHGEFLRVRGYRPPCCNLYMQSVIPHEKRPQKYQHWKGSYSQTCVDGKGYKPASSHLKDGSQNLYEGAMAEQFAVRNERAYWAGAKFY